MAVEASSLNERLLKHRLTAINAKRVKLRAQAQEIVNRMQSLVLEYTLKVGAGGRSFGAISARDIEVQLKEKGFELDRRQIKLLEPIRKAGEFKVQVKLHSEVSANIPVIVRAEAPKVEASQAEGEGRSDRRRRGSRKAKTEETATEESQSEGAAPTTPTETELN
jgi:large subunit ribosomal protein L9